MRILFFTYDFPYPANSGGKTRAFNLLKFAKKDAEITLFSFVRNSFEKKYIAELKKININDVHVFPRKNLFDFRTVASVFSGKSFFFTLFILRRQSLMSFSKQ